MRYLILLVLALIGIGVFFISERFQDLRQDDFTTQQNEEIVRRADQKTSPSRTRFAAEQVLAASANTDMATNVSARVKVITLLEKAAREGDAKAMYELGVIYFDRPGFYHEPLVALAWFTRAYEKGNSDAEQQLLRLCPGWKSPAHDLYLASEAALHGDKSATLQISQICTWDGRFKTTWP